MKQWDVRWCMRLGVIRIASKTNHGEIEHSVPVVNEKAAIESTQKRISALVGATVAIKYPKAPMKGLQSFRRNVTRK